MTIKHLEKLTISQLASEFEQDWKIPDLKGIAEDMIEANKWNVIEISRYELDIFKSDLETKLNISEAERHILIDKFLREKAWLEAKQAQESANTIAQTKNEAENLKSDLEKQADKWEKALSTWIEQKIPWGGIVVSFFSKIWSTFWKVWDVYKKSWLMAAIWFLFGNIFGFGEDDEKKDIKEVKEVKKDNNEKLMNQVKYTWWIKFLLSISDSNIWIYNFNYENIKKNSIQTLLNEKKKWSEWISERLGIKGDKNINNEIYNTVVLIEKNDKMLDSMLKNENPNWRNETLETVILQLGPYLPSFTMLNNSISSDTLNKFSFWNFTTLSELLLKRQKSWNSKLKWVSKELLTELVWLWWENWLKINEAEDKLSGNTFKKPKEEEFEKDLIRFWKDFLNILKNNFFIWKESERENFNKYFDDRSLTVKESVELYIITDWLTDVVNYSDMTKTMIYSKIWFMMWSAWDKKLWNELRANTYNEYFVNWIKEDMQWIEDVPDSMKVVGENVGIKMLESMLWIILNKWDLLWEAWQTIDSSTRDAMLLAAIWAGGLYIKSHKWWWKRHWSWLNAAKAFAFAWLAVLVWKMAYQLSKNKKFMAEHIELEGSLDVWTALISEVSETTWLTDFWISSYETMKELVNDYASNKLWIK